MTLRPAAVEAPDTAEDDPRLGRWLARPDAPREPGVVLVGFPSDAGVARNGGRPGAAAATRAIREALYRLTPDATAPEAFVRLLERTHDLGDVEVTGDVERDQAVLGETLAPHLARGAVALVLGGGHETTYGHVLGYVGAGRRVGLLNWDAHPDVRPLRDGRGHSGSPFRQALEHPSGACTGYAVAGLHPHAVARAHLDYLRARGADVVWRGDLDAARAEALVAARTGPTLASFDLDAVGAAHAPGVSAPNADGLEPRVWLRAAYACGRSPHVASMDVVELNPSYDQDGRTGRLAALTVWWFLKGVAERPC